MPTSVSGERPALEGLKLAALDVMAIQVLDGLASDAVCTWSSVCKHKPKHVRRHGLIMHAFVYTCCTWWSSPGTAPCHVPVCSTCTHTSSSSSCTGTLSAASDQATLPQDTRRSDGPCTPAARLAGQGHSSNPYGLSFQTLRNLEDLGRFRCAENI